MKNPLKRLTDRLSNRNWPKKGKVVDANIDAPRSITYNIPGQRNVPVNENPIHWLKIKPAEGKAEWVITTEADWKAHPKGSDWTRTPGTESSAKR
jgi:hypothetical protein